MMGMMFAAGFDVPGAALSLGYSPGPIMSA